MIKWLKRFWFDLGNLPKPEWGLKYMLPVLQLFFTWGFAGHLYLATISKRQLVPETGIVKSIAVKMERGSRSSKYYPLKISLMGKNYEYRVMDKFDSYFPAIQSAIIPGDTVSLYVRNYWQYILSWGRKKDVLLIEKKGHTVFPISAYRKDAQTLSIFLAFLSAIFWAVYFLYKKKIILKKRFEYPENK